MHRTSLCADQEHEDKLNKLGDSLRVIGQYLDCTAFAVEVDPAAPRPNRDRRGRPPFPTRWNVYILLIQQLFNLSHEQTEYHLLVCLSFLHFVGLRAGTSDAPHPLARPVSLLAGMTNCSVSMWKAFSCIYLLYLTRCMLVDVRGLFPASNSIVGPMKYFSAM